MPNLKRVCMCVIIIAISCATNFFSTSPDVEEENQRQLHKSNEHTQQDKRIGRHKEFLIAGKTECDDQLIVTGTDLCLLGLNLANACNSLNPAKLVLGLVGGYLTADLASGIVHMTLDNIDPNFGPEAFRGLSQDFQNHHKDPWRMKVDSFWFQNASLYTVALCTFASALVMNYFGYDLSAYLITTTMGWNMLTQLAHACAHGKLKGNKVIEFLQNNGIIMSPKHHSKHHTPPYDKNFCILAGHMEPVAQFIYSTAKRAISLGKSFFTQAEAEHVSQ